MADSWHCDDCDYDNENVDECESCGAQKPAGASGDDDDKFKGIVVGIVEEMEQVEGKDKLKKLKVNVGSNSITVVTNAPNVTQGCHLCVAQVGAKVAVDGNDIVVKKTSVGGVPSEGIICDAPMLGWTGGGAGNAALVPDSFAAGARPPEARPRMK